LVPLTRDAAEKLDGRIRRLAKQAGDQLVQVGRLLDEAKAGRIHEALGHPSWTAYIADALGGQLQLSGEARQAMVQLMASEGMSVRAISAATGVSKSTVDRDISQVSHDGTVDADSTVPQRDSSPPEGVAVTGLNGKTYTKPKRKPRPKKKPAADPAPDPVKERRPQIRSVFRANVHEIDRIYQETHRLGLDPRWKGTTLAAKDVQKLELVITGLKQLHHLASQKAVPQKEEITDDDTVEATA
jgi:transposase-like protein